MTAITHALPWIEIVLALLLSIGILLQQSGAATSALGGGDASTTFHTRRGFEKFLFIYTIVVAILFVGTLVFALLA